ncbi:shufflon system plasmid conjugative transfer pilus tip adhesin PilV [Herbaspirillum sp. GCM10030257]|uniref:shufflon system plasmid conjugative transfer pilus tip adhesin PilV n=1 Tax=Herbaspirillum sp. GCM10030257 TaxID=3273393 RepID=UPI003611BAF5
MNSTQRGMTIIEILGVLAIGSAMLIGLSAIIDSSLEDLEGQQAALYQAQVAGAARKYISANYQALLTATPDAASVARVSIVDLRDNLFLPQGFALTNGYGQATCVLVRQPTPGSGRLDALVVSYGGQQIEDRVIPAIAANAGQGSGYITTAVPTTARGASWNMDTLAYRNVACPGAGVPALTGAAADGGHLVSGLFYDGPGQLSTDFLYRNDVPGRPELNQMRTPVHMLPGSGAQATENDSTDPRCTAASGTGKIAVDAQGRVLSCQGGAWKRQSGYWKDPVASFNVLPATGNDVGDVRMVTALSRAFTWSGTAWTALAVDQDGNMLVPATLTANNVQLNQTVVKNTVCSGDGLLARDSTGLVMSCQSGTWRSLLDTRITTKVFENDYVFTSALGAAQNYKWDFVISLNAIPRPRPLYVTGYAHCHATSDVRAFVNVELRDASHNILAYAGGCGARSESADAGSFGKGFVPLQKIPENATLIRVYMESGIYAGDYSTLKLVVYNSD